MTTLAIALAMLSAVFAALGAYLQHGGVNRVTGGGVLHLRSLGLLARDRHWLLGVLAHVGTAVCQIAAISLAPLVVVQPIVVLALPLVALLGARATGIRLPRLTAIGIATTAGGLAVFVVLASRSAVGTPVSGEQAFLAGQFIGATALVLVLFAAKSSGRLRSVMLAVAAGMLYGLVSVLIRRITYAIDTDSLLDLPVLSVGGLLAAFLAGSWLVQSAYASGPPDLVVACAAVFNPIVAIAIGVSVLGETAGMGSGMAGTLAVCGSVALLGIFALARSHATLPGVPPFSAAGPAAGTIAGPSLPRVTPEGHAR